MADVGEGSRVREHARQQHSAPEKSGVSGVGSLHFPDSTLEVAAGSELSQPVARKLQLRDQHLPLSQRFEARVHRTDYCWNWTGAFRGSWTGNDYGALRVGRRVVLAHRVSWELSRGPVPEGMDVLHRCDNPRCVRPEHLFLGTQQDNNRDMAEKGRASWQRNSPVARGEIRAKTASARIARIDNKSTLAVSTASAVGTYRPATEEERRARALAVLRGAHALLLRDGWVRRPLGPPRPNEPEPPGWTLGEAIAEAGNVGVACEWARKAVRRVIGDCNIPGWNNFSYRTRDEVFAVLGKAIELCGGQAPRRGGWQIGGTQ